MRYVPKTKEDAQAMLKEIGVKSTDELFSDIPRNLFLRQKLNVPRALTEIEMRKHMQEIASKNIVSNLNFLGAGSYQHYIPAVVNHLIFRSEFYTAYTPYQAEMSQGILQALYEYQSLMCELTGMDAANASMYEGSSALAESCIMAANIKKKKKILISKTVHPEYREVVKTYAHFFGIEIKEIEYVDGATSLMDIETKLDDETAAVIIQSPNFFGIVEQLEKISAVAHSKNALLIASFTDATSLGILLPQGKFADIAVGEGQSFGNPVNFGGPYYGILATKNDYVRNLPGRIVGATVDSDGKRGFTLTLQAREQHIRREKASSNICTSQVLNALAATIYLASVGKNGLKEIAQQNVQKANYALAKIKEAGFKQIFNKPFYNEFVIKFDDIQKVNAKLIDEGIVGGLDLGRFYPELKNCALFCVTEIHSRQEIDKLVLALKGVD